LRRLARRSIVLTGAIATSGAVVLAAGSHFILLLFGRQYSDHGSIVLAGLAIGAPANALNAWASNLLKVTKQLSPMIVSNVVYTIVIVGMVWTFAHKGLGLVAVAWLCGNLSSGLIAAAALRVSWSKHVRPVTPSHRAGHQSASNRRFLHLWPETKSVARRVPLLASHQGLHAKRKAPSQAEELDRLASGGVYN
jgi:hypothetical protein